MTKSKAPAPLKQVIKDILVPLGQGGRLVEADIMSGWTTIVGSQLAGKCFPYYLKDGVLTVGVSSSPWLNQLQFYRDEIVRKVNVHLGKAVVASVRLVLKKLPADRPESCSAPPPGRELSAGERQEIEEACRPIVDPVLRDTVRRVLQLQATFLPRKR